MGHYHLDYTASVEFELAVRAIARHHRVDRENAAQALGPRGFDLGGTELEYLAKHPERIAQIDRDASDSGLGSRGWVIWWQPTHRASAFSEGRLWHGDELSSIEAARDWARATLQDVERTQ